MGPEDLPAEIVRLRAQVEELRAENATLRAERAEHEAMIAVMDEGVFVQDHNSAILTCNKAAEEILGLSAAQMSGLTSLDPRWRSVHEDGSPFPGSTHPVVETLRTGKPSRRVVMGIHKPSGELTWIAINTQPLVPVDGSPMRVVATISDITDYRKAVDELQATEARLLLALRAAHMGAWQWEIGAEELIWSDTVEDVFGVPRGSFDGRFETYINLIHPEDRDRVRIEIETALAAGPGHDTFYVRHRIKHDHEERWIDGHARVFRDAEGQPVRMAGVAVDVTEAHKLELQARRTQRLEAIGRLAGGVAHDFNNVLTVILSAIDLATRPGRDPGPDLAMIRDAANRAARLTGQLLAFARRQAIGKSTFDLGVLVSDLRRLLDHLLGEHVELTVDVAPGAWTVHADAGQIEQVLINLVANARDAIETTGHVRVGVGIGATPAEIAVTIADDGAGMAPEVLEHVFEPFFSTKDVGTGLGMATAYGIVQQHGGRIEIDSAVGLGTRVIVRLPRSERPSRPAAPPVRLSAARGTETLLLVEDDDMVRRVAESVLVAQGYRVLTAADGLEGLELARRHLDEIAAVLTDVVMPRLGGTDLARRLRELRPSLPVLLMTGYDPAAHDSAAAKLPKLDKPYTPDDLIRRVRALLDPKPPG